MLIHYTQVRLELQAEISRQRDEGCSHRQPEVTTKHGKLKPDRKSKPQPMYVDDLAALDILSEVCCKDSAIAWCRPQILKLEFVGKVYQSVTKIVLLCFMWQEGQSKSINHELSFI
jgi:hypothetical protein